MSDVLNDIRKDMADLAHVNADLATRKIEQELNSPKMNALKELKQKLIDKYELQEFFDKEDYDNGIEDDNEETDEENKHLLTSTLLDGTKFSLFLIEDLEGDNTNYLELVKENKSSKETYSFIPIYLIFLFFKLSYGYVQPPYHYPHGGYIRRYSTDLSEIKDHINNFDDESIKKMLLNINYHYYSDQFSTNEDRTLQSRFGSINEIGYLINSPRGFGILIYTYSNRYIIINTHANNYEIVNGQDLFKKYIRHLGGSMIIHIEDYIKKDLVNDDVGDYFKNLKEIANNLNYYEICNIMIENGYEAVEEYILYKARNKLE